MYVQDQICRVCENEAFLTEQIITYIGNKRALLGFIEKAVLKVTDELHKDRLTTFDVFSGSGIVSRFLKRYSDKLYCNDLEKYASVINKCYLTNRNEIDYDAISRKITELKMHIEQELSPGFITELYSPKDDENIQRDERVFYTRRNAMYIDTARQIIESIPNNLRCYFLAPLLYGASVHNNTSGVFKGFYKNKEGIGQYGGTGRNALIRILGNIELQMPVFSNFESEVSIFQKDANEAVKHIKDIDLAYLDPPYNQHPYGSNYFMLNLITDYKKPTDISNVSGIPTEWNRSNYNKKNFAFDSLLSLVENIDAKYVLISYNTDGFIKYEEFITALSKLGELESFSKEYNTFKGCRNLNDRDIHVKELLFLLKKK